MRLREDVQQRVKSTGQRSRVVVVGGDIGVSGEESEVVVLGQEGQEVSLGVSHRMSEPETRTYDDALLLLLRTGKSKRRRAGLVVTMLMSCSCSCSSRNAA